MRSTARSLLAYLQIRAQLFALECKEASVLTGRRFAVWFLAGLLLFVGYSLLVVSLIELLASALGLRWVWPALLFAALHLGGGAAVWWLALTRLKRPLFEATLQELEKDQQWITQNLPSNPKKPG